MAPSKSQQVVIRKNDAASSVMCGERPVVARDAASGVVGVRTSEVRHAT